MKLAVICSAHGFGHLGRQLALDEYWRQVGVEATYFTAVSPDTVRQWLPMAQVVPWRVDVGLFQPDSLQEDVEKTRILLEERCSEWAIDALSERLSGWDGALVDIAPAGLEACRRAGIPAVAVGNFDWAWIYQAYPSLCDWSLRFAAWQAPHPAVELWPGPGLHGFRSIQAGGLLARASKEAWKSPQGQKTVLVCFGGFGLLEIEKLLPEIPGVSWVLSPPMPRLDRPDCQYVDDVAFPRLVAGVDAVLTKPGYGILGECLRAGTPIVWVDRGPFPEAASLVKVMEARGDQPAGSDLKGALLRLWSQPRPFPMSAPLDPLGGQILSLLRTAIREN